MSDVATRPTHGGKDATKERRLKKEAAVSKARKKAMVAKAKTAKPVGFKGRWSFAG